MHIKELPLDHRKVNKFKRNITKRAKKKLRRQRIRRRKVDMMNHKKRALNTVEFTLRHTSMNVILMRRVNFIIV